MIDEARIDESGIYLKIWGQEFTYPLSTSPSQKQKTVNLGETLKAIGTAITTQALRGVPMKYSFNGVNRTSFGFDESGELIKI